MKKIASILMALALLACLQVNVLATDNSGAPLPLAVTGSPRYTVLSGTYEDVEQNNDQVRVFAGVSAWRSAALSISVKVEEVINGSYYTKLNKTVRKTGTDLEFVDYFSTSPGCKYRITIRYTAGVDQETFTIYHYST